MAQAESRGSVTDTNHGELTTISGGRGGEPEEGRPGRQMDDKQKETHSPKPILRMECRRRENREHSQPETLAEEDLWG